MKKSILLSIFCLSLAFNSTGQVWLPLNNGINPSISSFRNYQSVYYNGLLYVAAKECNSGCDLIVRTWDGISWNTLPTTNFGNSGLVTDIIAYNGSIYVAGGSFYLHKFNGSSWSQPLSGTNITGQARDMVVYNGELVASGNFQDNGSPRQAIHFDGTSWGSYPLITTGTNFDDGQDAKVHNGDLYITTREDSLNLSPLNVFKWDGTTWVAAASNFYNSSIQRVFINKLSSLNNKLYGWGDNSLHEIRNDSLILLTSYTSGYFYPVEEITFQGEIYYTGYGSATSPFEFFKTDGQTLTYLTGLPPTMTGQIISFSTDGTLLYATGSFRVTNNSGHNHAMATTGSVATLTGNVFLDGNANCTQNTGESGLSGAMLNFNPGNINIVTDANGHYSLGVNSGTYSLDNVQLTNSLHANVNISTCNSLPQSIIAVTGTNTQTDIAAELPSNIADAAVILSAFRGNRAIFGFTDNYQLKVQNRGSITLQNLDVSITMPSGLQISSASPNYTSSSGNVYTWSLSSLSSLDEFESVLAIEIDTGLVHMGDTLIFTGATSTVPGDISLNNNTSTLLQTVVGAVDPNDKQVNKVEILPGTDKLEYHIRFQNTGTDTAYTVRIEDELESRLKLEELEIISSSHNYVMRTEGRKVIWTFNNILLPDSGANYSGSQGFIKFSIGLDPTLAIGDVVLNDADIFFDFQPPVHTNDARTTVVSTVSLAEGTPVNLIEFYPNPAKEAVHLVNTQEEDLTFSLIDATGKVVDTITIKAGTRLTYTLDHLGSGLYFLKSDKAAYRLLINP